jgi:hypothetical protein
MRALSTGLLALAIFVVAVGFFRLWFVLSTPGSEAANDKVNINLTVDTDRVKQDAKIGTGKASESTSGTTKEVPADGPIIDNLKSTGP